MRSLTLAGHPRIFYYLFFRIKVGVGLGWGWELGLGWGLELGWVWGLGEWRGLGVWVEEGERFYTLTINNLYFFNTFFWTRTRIYILEE